MDKYRVVPYDIFGVKLYSVERCDHIEKYCDDKVDAQQQCDKLNNNYQPHLITGNNAAETFNNVK